MSSVAGKAGAHRVTAYNTLHNLEQKSFVKKTKRRRVRFYYAINPQIILNQIEEKYRTAKMIVPELIDLQNVFSFKPKIRFFEGGEELKNIFKDILAGKGEMIGYTNFSAAQRLFADYVFKHGETVLKMHFIFMKIKLRPFLLRRMKLWELLLKVKIMLRRTVQFLIWRGLVLRVLW